MARMLADDAPLIRQSFITPDNSLRYVYQEAWCAYARQNGRTSIVPRMLTLMDWAKENGAQDWDARLTERALSWMQMLREVPQLSALLIGQTQDEAAEHAETWLNLVYPLMSMSDELTLHLLAGRAIDDAARTVRQAIDRVYRQGGSELAQQELAVLLHCWQADVDDNSPMVRFLRTLYKIADNQSASKQSTGESETVWVLRNRPWLAYETHFWSSLARIKRVVVLDITQFAVSTGVARARAIAQMAGKTPNGLSHLNGDSDSPHLDNGAVRWATPVNHVDALPVRVYAAEHSEAQAVATAQTILRWRARHPRANIGVVALDRQASRRVWALLQQAGVPVRDDSGWRLSTARVASVWGLGLNLMSGEVRAETLLDWFSHPAVWAGRADKATALHGLRRCAQNQTGSSGKLIYRHWQDWVSAAQRLNASPAQPNRYAHLLEWLHTMHHTAQLWQSPRTAAQWAQVWRDWMVAVGAWAAVKNDDAGQNWCARLDEWATVAHPLRLTVTTAIQLLNREVEQLTYRPHSAVGYDGRGEVVLMPLGSTRLRQFDAVWLLGADAAHLPGTRVETGLLNHAVRRTLNLPCIEDEHALLRQSLLDLVAQTPLLCASYTVSNEGTPNAISPWLAQYLRAVRSWVSPRNARAWSVERLLKSATHAVTAQTQPMHAATVAAMLPAHISASGLARLAACPYQYFVADVLTVRRNDLPDDDIDPTERGELWHRVVAHYMMARAAQQKNQASESPFDDEALCRSSIDAVVLPLCRQHPRYWETHTLFNGYIPALVGWWQGQLAQGWRYRDSEHSPDMSPHIIRDDVVVRWSGRIDQRNTRMADGQPQTALIDHKSGRLDGYRRALKADEDIQLAFYANLLIHGQENDSPVAAHYVGVSDNEKLAPTVGFDDADDITRAADELRTRVAQLFTAMADDAPLNAMGTGVVCARCEARAVCRKNHTTEQPQETP